MKRISRERLRGKSLDEACTKARTTTNEYGPEDKRVYCYGLYDAMTDEPLERCKICGAYVINETPLEIEKGSLNNENA